MHFDFTIPIWLLWLMGVLALAGLAIIVSVVKMLLDFATGFMRVFWR